MSFWCLLGHSILKLLTVTVTVRLTWKGEHETDAADNLSAFRRERRRETLYLTCCSMHKIVAIYSFEQKCSTKWIQIFCQQWLRHQSSLPVMSIKENSILGHQFIRWLRTYYLSFVLFNLFFMQADWWWVPKKWSVPNKKLTWLRNEGRSLGRCVVFFPLPPS